MPDNDDRRFTIVELDRLLTDPDLAALVKPGADPRTDQMTAAKTEASRLNEHAIRSGMYRGSLPIPAAQIPEWIRLGALTELYEWFHNRSATCVHHPVAGHPEPVIAGAWKPGMVVCQHCEHLLNLPSRSAVNRRCDHCGTVVREIYPNAFQVGPLTWRFGVCEDCHREAGLPA
jgi:hypothetical protein